MSTSSILVVVLLGALALGDGIFSSARAAGDTVTLAVPERLLSQEAAVKKFLGALRCPERACPPVQISVVRGNDYEILDWFGKELVDLAIVPDSSAFLLQRDDVNMIEVALLLLDLDDAGEAIKVVPPRLRPVASEPTDGDLANITRFSQWVWCQAADKAKRWQDANASLLVERPADAPGTGKNVPAVACKEVAGRRYQLEVPSHLLGFSGAVDIAAGWLETRIGPWQCSESSVNWARRLVQDAFWDEFLLHTRFTLGRGMTTPAGVQPIRLELRRPEKGRPVALERVVATRRAADRLGLDPWAIDQSSVLPRTVTRVWSRPCGGSLPVTRPFRSLVEVEPAFGVRTFSFSTQESVELLRQHRNRLQRPDGRNVAEAGPSGGLALVLPGGGVKAAYQTVLLERLYGKKLLRNVTRLYGQTLQRDVRGDPPVSDAPLDVNYVIGTSGGALLGYFAARLTGDGPWHLDTALWERCSDAGRPCRTLESTDIFGYLDMPRYISGLTIYLVLVGVLSLSLLRGRHGDAAAAPERWRWRPRLLLSVGSALLFLPFVIRYVNGDPGREHIAEIEGLVYAGLAILVMFADQCILRGPTDEGSVRTGLRRAGRGLLIVGTLLTLAAVVVRWWSPANPPSPAWFYTRLDFSLPWIGMHLSIQEGAVIVCVGGILFVVGAILWTIQHPAYRLHDVAGFGAGLGVGLLHLILVFLILWGLMLYSPWPPISLLELTLEYWRALLVASVVVAVVLLLTRSWTRRWRVTRFVACGTEYLCSAHQHGGLVPRRFARLALIAVFAIGWWNLVIAPAMYGNGPAGAFLRAVERNFERENPKIPRTLATSLIVTANALETDGTDGARYFAFLPASNDCLRLTRRSGYGARWSIYTGTTALPGRGVVPTVDCFKGGSWTLDVMRDVVFASGSPYPVFAAHRVVTPKTSGNTKPENAERLVDGGYANNVPIDAAQSVGADHVLIVESTNPLGHEEEGGLLRTLLSKIKIQGDLVDDLPRLFMFLYERSQQLDRISRRELLVVSLAPPQTEAGWPSLVQFRTSVVERMKDVATTDWELHRRNGMVQSWGRPRIIDTVTVTRAGGKAGGRTP